MKANIFKRRLIRTVCVASIVTLSIFGSIGVNASISNQLMAPNPIAVDLNEESTFSAETEFAKQVLLAIKKFCVNRY